MSKLSVVVAAVLLAVGATGCGSSGGSGSPETVTVFAASSLTSTFTALGKQFEAQHPGVRVKFSFGGSSDLVAQIQAGAPADVFASADTRNMDKLGGTATDPRSFASNTLEIAVPPGNPAGIRTLADLTRPGVKLVICAAEVPCGAAAQAVAHAAGLSLKPVSEEQSVTDVLGKVSSGEADAGLVYVTDVRSAGSKVEGLPFPEAAGTVNVYPIATLHGSEHSGLAHEFVDLVLSSTGQKVLSDAGFGKP